MSKMDKKTVSRIMEIADELTAKEFTYTLRNPMDSDEIVAVIPLKAVLSVDEKAAFVDRVVNGVFDDENYMPWLLDPIFMITLVQMTTNVPIYRKKAVDDSTGEKIDIVDIEKTYTLAKAMNLRNVGNDVYQNLIVELQGMIADKIEYRKQMNFRKRESFLNNLQAALDRILATVDQLADNENMGKLLEALHEEKELSLPEVKHNGN